MKFSKSLLLVGALAATVAVLLVVRSGSKHEQRAKAARTGSSILVHPAIIRRQQEFLNNIARTDPKGIGIVSAALMVEIGTYKNYDKVIVLSCPPNMQRMRLKTRSRLSDEQIEARLAAQMPVEDKVKHADFVIDTSTDLATTRRHVEMINSRLRELASNT